MYKLIIKHNGEEKELEFASVELAQLYRDYHLAFGHWNGLSRWIEEKSMTQEEKAYIIDEMTQVVNGEIVRLYKITDGVELKIEEVDSKELPDVWRLFRAKRSKMLDKTDWSQLGDSALPMELKKDYRAYRSYLRALPSLHDDSTIASAKIYSFEEWKKGKR